jgi:hypothetical protein
MGEAGAGTSVLAPWQLEANGSLLTCINELAMCHREPR